MPGFCSFYCRRMDLGTELGLTSEFNLIVPLMWWLQLSSRKQLRICCCAAMFTKHQSNWGGKKISCSQQMPLNMNGADGCTTCECNWCHRIIHLKVLKWLKFVLCLFLPKLNIQNSVTTILYGEKSSSLQNLFRISHLVICYWAWVSLVRENLFTSGSHCLILNAFFQRMVITDLFLCPAVNCLKMQSTGECSVTPT